MNRPRILAFAILFCALGVAALWADQPNCQTAPPLKPGDLTIWPLHARLANNAPGAARSGLMNDFGEFQRFPPDYVHTGIDIRGVWNAGTSKGDVVLVAAPGDVWMAPAFSGDSCTSDNNCRALIKSNDRRHIFYYAHLNVRTDADSEVRAKLETAAMNDPASDLPVGANPVSAGQKLAGIGLFFQVFAHLHFGIFDACEDYDGLNPLGLLPAPDGYVDETLPTVGPVLFVREDGSTQVQPQDCGTPLTGTVDLMVEAKDIFHDLTAGSPALPATNSNGIYKATYRIRQTPAGPTNHDGTWYQFDRATYRCRGAQRGKSCTDAAALPLLTQNDFLNTVLDSDKAPSLGIGFADNLFNIVSGPFSSVSDYSGVEQYFHVLTHEWGYTDQAGKWDTAALPDGRYQVSVEVSDQAGNKAASNAFVILSNHGGGVAPGDLVVRDNLSDVGAIPSSLGGNPFWISPDIKVTAAADPDLTDPGAGLWNQTQDVTVVAGSSYKIWIRVQNHGCQTLHDVHAKVAWANPDLFQTEWGQIDVEKGGVDLVAGEAKILGPFAWTPAMAQAGHRCLLAISRSTEDPPAKSDFGTLVDGWGGTVTNDSDIAQLNLQVKATKFKVSTPKSAHHDLRLHFDCNDFPIYERESVAELVVGYHEGLAAAWANLPRTSLRREGNDLVLRFQGCKLDLPLARLGPGQEVPASMRLELGKGPRGAFRVDLSEVVDGEVAGGMSFTAER
ncbi:MAG TPA: hypothetical protein VGS07_04775 [Thermoanaerobaculia bacterium]|jgi:hypothetical protein|nr:hypothetical protein [Thermoanaerobaculia bacterium]